ncbi:MAG: PhzF family phenazine biosynthesis protein [Flavobacteriaceae bacterium]
MQHDYAILDVFTQDRYAGNPLAVVFDADDFSTELCRKVAAEFNLSETVFVAKASKPAHSAAIRIFTPASELPFAGHPTVGAAIMIARSRWPEASEQSGIVVLEEKIGTVRVGVTLGGKRGDFAEFDIPKVPKPVDLDLDRDRVAASLGIEPKEIGFENHKMSAWSAGVPYAYIPVRDLDVLRRCKVDLAAFENTFAGSGHAYVYCRETFSQRNDFHARMFAPPLGVLEDPATGSAAAGFSAVLMQFDQPPAGEHRYAIEQGHIMGRPSIIDVELVIEGGRMHTVRIGGSAVVVATGSLTI